MVYILFDCTRCIIGVYQFCDVAQNSLPENNKNEPNHIESWEIGSNNKQGNWSWSVSQQKWFTG